MTGGIGNREAQWIKYKFTKDFSGMGWIMHRLQYAFSIDFRQTSTGVNV